MAFDPSIFTVIHTGSTKLCVEFSKYLKTGKLYASCEELAELGEILDTRLRYTVNYRIIFESEKERKMFPYVFWILQHEFEWCESFKDFSQRDIHVRQRF